MTEPLIKSERKTISLDLDDKHALPKQISLTEPGPTLKEKKDTHSNKEKEKKPSTKEKKVKTGGDTSIIDSILKKNKVLPIVSSEKKAHLNGGVTSEPKKKMILDLNSDEQIITHDTKPVPEIKPALQFVPEKPTATIILKSEAKKQKQIHANSPESQFKLDTLFNIDSSINQTQSVASVITEPHNSLPLTLNSKPTHGVRKSGITPVALPWAYNPGQTVPSFSPPSYSDSTVQNTGQKQLSPEFSVSGIDYAKELTEIDNQLAKVRAKLAKRGPDSKYLEMQTKLEERRAKYIRRQQRQEAGGSKPKPGVPLTLNSKPISTLDESRVRRIGVTPVALHWACNPVQTVPEMVNKTSNIAPPIQSASNANSGLSQLFKRKTPTANTTQPDLLDEVNQELRKAKDMLTNIEQNQDGSNSNAHQPILSSAPGKKVIKEQGTSIFAIPSELTSMREKKEHLLAEQRKIAERIGHRQKQIDKLKNWQREVEKMNELQAEKQKIFELQQDLKRLEKQQYEQDQKLKGQMYQVRKMAHSKSNELKRLDMIDTFKAVKQRPQSVPLVINNNLSHTCANSSPTAVIQQSGFGGKLRAAINKLFAGERVMFTKNNTIPAPIKQVAPLEPLIITEDAKTGLEYRTVTPVNDDNSLMHPFTSPAQKNDKNIVDVINMAKQIDVKSSEPETQISKHQINVYRDYFCDKVGISKKGINNCFDLMPNKDENHTAILVNAYKELCDEIKFG